jgi:hypothetical protein
MESKIRQYGFKDLDGLDGFLADYRDVSDYRYAFASREWIGSFIRSYRPEANFLVLSEKGKNYFSLSINGGKISFTGDPFNDFNGAFPVDPNDEYDFDRIFRFFRGLGLEIDLTNVFEPDLIGALSKHCEMKPETTGLKIVRNEETDDYDSLVSRRIRLMYERSRDDLEFSRIFGDGIKNNVSIMKDLLVMRQAKLLNKKMDEFNPSFEPRFNEFLLNLASLDSIRDNIFIDYCAKRSTGKAMASSFNFAKSGGTICYVRAHFRSEGGISYGLVLDYWGNKKSFDEGIRTIDLTRGNEPYKYRLGMSEYKLLNFSIKAELS